MQLVKESVPIFVYGVHTVNLHILNVSSGDCQMTRYLK